MMADPLSVSAGSFAVVGVLDVVLRAGRGLHAFFGAIKDAPRDLDELKRSLGDVILLVADVQAYRRALENSPLNAVPITSMNPNSKPQPQITLMAALRSLQRELSSLTALVKRHKDLANPWEKLKYMLDEKKIRASVQKLETFKSTLNSVLGVIGRRRDISTHKIIREDIRQGVHTITSTIQNKLHEDKRDIQGFVENATSRCKEQIASLGTSILASSSEEHKRSRAHIIQSKEEVINAIHTEIESLPTRLAEVRLKAAKRGGEIRFLGLSQDALLNLLLLLKPAMRWAISHLLSHHPELVSEERIQFLMSQFNHLLASASQEVAASYEGSTASSFDEWMYAPERYAEFSEQSAAPGDVLDFNDDLSENSSMKRKAAFEQRLAKRQRSSLRRFEFSTPIGELQIRIGSRDSLNDLTSGRDEWKAGFTFSAKPNKCSTWLNAQFIRTIGVESKPRLYTQLTMLNVISEDRYKVYLGLCGKPISEFDKALRAGLISPYDAHSTAPSESYLFCAIARFRRIDLANYLRGQGLQAFTVDGGRGAFLGIFRAVVESEDGYDKRLLQRFVQDSQHFDLEEALQSQVLHPITWSWKTWPSKAYLERFKCWMSFLKSSDYDFERERNGLTPLLSYASTPGADSVSTISLLLGFGANIHATNSWGGNSIHCSIASTEHNSVFERKLRVLIEAGCDIYHCDAFGRSPCDMALGEGCWEEWCMALESSGFDLTEVILENEHRKTGLPSVRPNRRGSEKSDDQRNSHEFGYQYNLCPFHSRVQAMSSWLSKRALLNALYNEFKDGITLINSISNGRYGPLLSFLQEISLELLASDEDQANARYNEVYDCIVELQNSTCTYPRIPESLLPIIPEDERYRMPGDREVDINDGWIIALGKMKRAYLIDQARQEQTLDIIDAYADSPAQTEEQDEGIHVGSPIQAEEQNEDAYADFPAQSGDPNQVPRRRRSI